MPAIAVTLPVPAANGVGASVAIENLDFVKSIIISGVFQAAVTVEASPDGVRWGSIATYTGAGCDSQGFSALFARVRVSGYINGTAFVTLAAEEIDPIAVGAALPVPAGNGTGASTATDTMGELKTIVVNTSGLFIGSVNVESSDDGVRWGCVATFTTPGLLNVVLSAQFMRVRMSGYQSGSATCAVAGILSGAGGGGTGGGMVIGGAIVGGITPRVLYVGAGGVLAQDAGFTYDDTNNIATLTGGLELIDSAIAVSAAGGVRFRSSGGVAELSQNGGAYQPIVTGAGDLQSAYDLSPASSPATIVLDATRDGIRIEQGLADADPLFQVSDASVPVENLFSVENVSGTPLIRLGGNLGGSSFTIQWSYLFGGLALMRANTSTTVGDAGVEYNFRSGTGALADGATPAGPGGDFTVNSGVGGSSLFAGQPAGPGGTAFLRGGDGGSNLGGGSGGQGGDVSIQGGQGNDPNRGGNISITGGAVVGTGQGGSISITGGTAGTGAGGDVTITSGIASTAGQNVGDISITIPTQTLAAVTPGDITMTLGRNSAGTIGFVNIEATDAATVTPTDLLRLRHLTTGIAGVGYGASILFQGEDGSGGSTLEDIARIATEWATATAGSEISTVSFWNRFSGGALSRNISFGQESGASQGYVIRSIQATGLEIIGNRGASTSGDIILRSNVAKTTPALIVQVQRQTTNVYTIDFRGGVTQILNAQSGISTDNYLQFTSAAVSMTTSNTEHKHIDWADTSTVTHTTTAAGYAVQRFNHWQAPTFAITTGATISSVLTHVFEATNIGANVTGTSIATMVVAPTSYTAGPTSATMTIADFVIPAHTVTVSGAIEVTSTVGYAALRLDANTLSNAVAQNFDRAATLAIMGPPAGGGAGPVSIDEALSLYVAAGNSVFTGDVEVTGKLTVGGAIDPTSLTLVDAGNAAYIESAEGNSAAVSPANRGRLRYNVPTQTWQVSMNGAAYADLTTGGATTLQGAYTASPAVSPVAITLDATRDGIQILTGAANANPLLSVVDTSSSWNVNAPSIAAATLMTMTVSDAVAAVTDILSLTHVNAAAAIDGIGVGILFRAEDSGGAIKDAARIAGVLTDNAAGGEDTALVISLQEGGNGLLERVSFRMDELVDGNNQPTMMFTPRTTAGSAFIETSPNATRPGRLSFLATLDAASTATDFTFSTELTRTASAAMMVEFQNNGGTRVSLHVDHGIYINSGGASSSAIGQLPYLESIDTNSHTGLATADNDPRFNFDHDGASYTWNNLATPADLIHFYFGVPNVSGSGATGATFADLTGVSISTLAASANNVTLVGVAATLRIANTNTNIGTSNANWAYRDVLIPAHTLTLTGGTVSGISPTVVGVFIGQITVNDATANALPLGVSLYVAGPPLAGGAGPASYTEAHAFLVDSGTSRFDDQILAADGSATNPSYAFQGASSNTGFFRQAADVIGVSVNGNERFRFQEGATNGEFIPPVDDDGSIGTNANRWTLVRAVTITPGDIAFDDKFCPVCNSVFVEGDDLVLTVRKIEENDVMRRNRETGEMSPYRERIAFSVPMHARCRRESRLAA